MSEVKYYGYSTAWQVRTILSELVSEVKYYGNSTALGYPIKILTPIALTKALNEGPNLLTTAEITHIATLIRTHNRCSTPLSSITPRSIMLPTLLPGCW